MVEDIRDSKQFKNIGIDKDSVAEVAPSEEPEEQQGAKKDPAPIEAAPAQQPEPIKEKTEANDLKKEILDITNGQLVALAKQFQTYADKVNARLDKLEEQMQNMLRRENQKELSGAEQKGEEKQEKKTEKQPQQQELPKKDPAKQGSSGDSNSPTGNASFQPEDVSIEKMFNFSNKK
jgi:hypothetical protein